MATATCECGQTTCEFLTTKPLYGLECFCSDCYVKAVHFAICSKRDKSKVPLDVVKLKRPMNLQYFPGKVCVTPEGNLTFNQLRKTKGGMVSTNACAKCCGSLLFIDHPGYEEKILLVQPDFMNFSANYFENNPRFAGRIMIKDWNATDYDEYAKAHPIAGAQMYPVWDAHGNMEEVVMEGDFVPNVKELKDKDAVQLLESCADPTLELSRFKTARQLMGDFKEAGGKIEVLGIPDTARSNKEKVRVAGLSKIYENTKQSTAPVQKEVAADLNLTHKHAQGGAPKVGG